MVFLSLEHSKAAYRADFAFYTTAIAAMTLFSAGVTPVGQRGTAVLLTLLGLAGWTLIEYAMHRFVLHGVQPFQSWHAMHHARPAALIFAPTVVAAALITILVLLPAWVWMGRWRASALTLGVLIGYMLYSVTHHAIHHWRTGHRWVEKRKRRHALHHCSDRPGCYGVTTDVWDRVFGTLTLRPLRTCVTADPT